MSRTAIRFAELHAPLFSRAEGQHGTGTNLGMKLDPHARPGLKIEYDEETNHLYVTFNGITSRIPETNVVAMIEDEKEMKRRHAESSTKQSVGPLSEAEEAYWTAEAEKAVELVNMITEPRQAPVIKPKVTAQVETPQSHVHAGKGKGKTGKG